MTGTHWTKQFTTDNPVHFIPFSCSVGRPLLYSLSVVEGAETENKKPAQAHLAFKVIKAFYSESSLNRIPCTIHFTHTHTHPHDTQSHSPLLSTIQGLEHRTLTERSSLTLSKRGDSEDGSRCPVGCWRSSHTAVSWLLCFRPLHPGTVVQKGGLHQVTVRAACSVSLVRK